MSAINWYYKNAQGQIMGPFSNGDMRAWFEQNYLPSDLPITQNPRDGFNLLRDWFPNLQMAFVPQAQGQPGRSGSKISQQPVEASQRQKKVSQNQGNQMNQSQQLQSQRQMSAPDQERWYFLDTSGTVQGPFTNAQMSDWYADGYFQPTIQLFDAVTDSGWKTLRDHFVNSTPFGTANNNSAPAPVTQPVEEEEERFKFPTWLPKPPAYRGVPKVYPSEKNVN